MIAETLAGIALVKQSVDFIKSQIDTCNDISAIAGSIDGLFRGVDEANQDRNKRSQKAPGLADQFGVESVAQEMIDAKLAQEKLQEVAQMVDMRFGPGTWKGIVAERARRIQEHKEEMARIKKQKLKEQAEFWEQMKMMLIIVMALLLGGGAMVYVLYMAA